MVLLTLFGFVGYMIFFFIMSEGKLGRGNSLRISTNHGKGGGGGTTTNTTNTYMSPAEYQQMLDIYINRAGDIFGSQTKYAPQEAALNTQILQEQSTPMALAARQAAEAANPEQFALQNSLMQQAQAGSTGALDPAMARIYRNEYKANLGSNVGSPIGADYVSRGMQKQLFDQQNQYRQFGASLATGVPRVSAPAIATSNIFGSFTPSSVTGQMGNPTGSSTVSKQAGSGGLFGGLFG